MKKDKEPKMTILTEREEVDWNVFLQVTDGVMQLKTGKVVADYLKKRQCVTCGKDVPSDMNVIYEAAYQITGECEACQIARGMDTDTGRMFYGGPVRDFIIGHGGKR